MGWFSRVDDSWMDAGVCRQERLPVEMFILEQGYTAADAKKACSRCPVAERCRQYARETGSIGVWGGKVFSFKPETPDISPAPVQDMRPQIKRIVYFEPGKEPEIFGVAVASYHKPEIFG